MNGNRYWFAVDKEGLSKILERRGKAFAVIELIQNAWDEDGVRKVAVTLENHEMRGYQTLIVEDDAPDGFSDLSHAWTLFAESAKKDNPEQRGRFNIGEKLFLALCREARIETTVGSVLFDADGRHTGRKKRAAGSVIRAIIRMTQVEAEETLATLKTLIPPTDIVTTINGERLEVRQALHSFDVTLPTEISDEDGNLRPTKRKTRVRVYEPEEGETPSIYEMGIPVVETGDRWHYDVAQKVPLNLDRDNVRPSYLKELRAYVLNEMHERITEDDANETWVRDAMADKRATPEAVERGMDLRFGKKRVIYDPSDPEANSIASSKGYTVISSRMLNSKEWDNVKKYEAARPAGQVTPGSRLTIREKLFGDGQDTDEYPREKWTSGMEQIVAYSEEIGSRLIGRPLSVKLMNTLENFSAAYGHGQLYYNVKRLGKSWFEKGITVNVDRLLIHELGHDWSGDHLSSDYHEALCKLGAQLKRLALEEPELFERHTGEVTRS